MPQKLKDRIGLHYGRLVVIEFAGMDWDGNHWFSLWECQCDCGNIVIVRGSDLQKGNTKSCGCLRQETANKQGKNHSAYIDGKYCGKFTKAILKLKEQKRKHDNYTCQNCGITQEEIGRKLDVHHIDGDNTNNDPDNMITLCRSCHKIRHKIKEN